ncbi:MAG: Uma2 family endonuclease [Janthinobacterium lividum]
MGLSALKTNLPAYVSPEEYLRLEEEATEKHEYYGGRIWPTGDDQGEIAQIRAMAGASAAHNRLCFNLSGLLFSQLDNGPCEGYTSDQRVQVLNASTYLYPDLSVVCGEAKFNDAKKPDNLLNPTLIVEVLSASTSRDDRSEKFMLYRQLPSLNQYLMLDSQSVHAELYTRQDNDHWLYRETRDLAAVLDLSSIGATLPLARLYQGVKLVGA